MPYTVGLPDGRSVEFPDSVSRDQAAAIIRDQLLGQKPENTVGTALMRGLSNAASSIQTAVESVVGTPEEAAKRGVERGDEITRKYGEGASLEDLKKVYNESGLLAAAGEVIGNIPAAIAEQAPNIAENIAGAAVGTMVGGPVGGVIGALTPSLITQYGGNIERQQQATPGDINRAAAIAAAVPQATLDVAGDVIPLGRTLGAKLFGAAFEKVFGKVTAEEAEKLAREGLAKTLAKGTAKGAAAEVPTEVAQQALERAQAGLPLTSPDAWQEYTETAYQVGLLAPIGAAGRVAERAEAREKIAEKPAEEPPATTGTTPPPVTPAPPAGEVAPDVSKLLGGAEATVDEQAQDAERAKFDETVAKIKAGETGIEKTTPKKTTPIGEDLVNLARAQIARTGKTSAPYIQNSVNKIFRESGTDRQITMTEAAVIRDSLLNEGYLVQDPEKPKAYKVAKPVTLETVKEEEKAAAEKKVVTEEKKPTAPAVSTEVQEAKNLLDAVDKGGLILNPAKVNKIATDLGLEVSKKSKPTETVGRIRDAVRRAESTAPINIEAKDTSKVLDDVVTTGERKDANTEPLTQNSPENPGEQYRSILQRLEGLINTQRIAPETGQRLKATIQEQGNPSYNPNFKDILSQADEMIKGIEERAEDFESGKLDVLNRRMSQNERLDMQNALLRQQEQAARERAQKQMDTEEAVKALRENSTKVANEEAETPKHTVKLREAVEAGDVKSTTQLLVDRRAATAMYPKVAEKFRPIFTAVARQLNKTDFSNVKMRTENSPDADLRVFKRLQEEGKYAEFNPATNEMNFRRDWLHPDVVMHEFVHAGTVKVIRQYEVDPSKLTDTQRQGVERLYATFDAVKNQESDTTLINEYPDAMKDAKEFIAVGLSSAPFQTRLANIEVVAPIGRKNMWTEFVRAIASAFNIKTKDDTATALDELGQAFSEILTAPPKEGVTGVAPLAAKKAEGEPKEIDPFAQMRAEEDKLKASKFSVVNSIRYWMSGEGYERAVQALQDRSRPIVKLERDLNRAGVAIWAAPEDGGNILSTVNDLAAGEYKNNENVVTPLANNLDKSVEAYVAKTAEEYEAAKTRLDTYFVAESINERRVTLHIFEKPLDTKPRVRLEGEKKLISYAELRQRLIDSVLSGKLDDATRNAIYGKLLDLTVRDTEHKYADPLGASYRQTEKTGEARKPGKRPLDFKDPYYDYIKGWDYKTTQKVLDEMKADKNQAEIAAVRKAVIDLDQVTSKFNEEAGFMTQPVKNLIKLYGWDKYVSLAGKTTKLANKYEGAMTYNSVPNEAPTAARGRETAPNSPIYLAKINAGKAAARAAKKNVVPTLVNLMKPNPISGKKYVKGNMIGTISFAERFKGETDLAESKFVGDNKFYNPLKNGDIEVWQVDDPKIAKSLRPEFEAVSPIGNMMRSITSLMGQGHTRYQLKFAPYDFLRNTSANTGLINQEFGAKSGAIYAGNVAKSVFKDLRIPQMWQVVAAYNKKDLESVKKIGGYNATTGEWADPYIRDAYEFIKRGGKTSIVRSWQTQSRLEEAYTEAKQWKVTKNLGDVKNFLDNYFDIWMDGFDMVARVDAYRVAKSIAMAKRGMNEESATIYAASFAKNLANFEKKGTSTRLSRWYMFWNPSATGAVRNMDALAPLVRDINTVVNELPEEIKDDPVARAKFIEKYNEEKKNALGTLLFFTGQGYVTYLMLHAVGGLLPSGGSGDEPPENEVASDNKELWTRNMRLPLNWLGMEGVKDKFFNIPWGFGFGSFAAFGSQIAATNMGGQSISALAGNTASIALDSYVPLPIARYNPFNHPIAWLLDSAMPSPFRGLVEYGLNVNGVGSPIYRDYYNKYGPTMVSNENTPQSYQDLANGIAKFTNNRYMFEPNELKFVASLYFDGIANLASSAYDMIGNQIRQERNFDPKQDLPFVGSFISNKINTVARDYYDSSTKLGSFKQGYEAALNSPDEKALDRFLAEFPDAPAIVAIYKQQDQGLKKLQEPINLISNYAKTPKERKAQTEEINEAKKAYMAASVQLYESNPEFKKQIDSFNNKFAPLTLKVK